MQFLKNLLSAAFLLFSSTVLAQQTTLLQTDKADLSINKVIRLKDAVEDPSSGGYILRKHKVRLEYTRSNRTDVYSGSDWTYQIDYKIYNYGSGVSGSTYSLKVAFKPSEENFIYEAIRVHDQLATEDLGVKIVGISTTGTVPDDIVLSVETETEVHYFLSPAAQGYVHFNNTAKEVRWKTVEGAKQYDVEWVFVDDESAAAYTAFIGATGNAKPFAFKEPVRVRTAGNSLRLEPTYPSGTLYFRVRPVGVWVVGVNGNYSHIKTGAWGYTKSPTDGTVAKHIISTSFEEDKNWQMVVTYAEEGKNKRVVSYYDGSLRNRQSLTNLSTQDVTLAAEQVYDFEGRPAVSILPAPLSNNTFGYKSNLNKKGSNAFSASDFDGKNGSALNTSATGSAAQYYSNNNLYKNQQTNGNFIPDAEGYVYAQNVYMRDNTGRMAISGGVGSTFKIGGDHETKYYYGTPSAVELYRLFGTNVGEASHYKKNMVMDPNGQLSVSYLDQEGRTIATALAGLSPDNLYALESNVSDESIQIDLLAGNNGWDLANGVATSVHRQLNVLPNNEFTFEYDITGALYEVSVTGLDPNEPQNSTDFCMDCEYALTISITDPDGNNVPMEVTSGPSDKLGTHNVPYQDTIRMTGDPDCSSSSTYNPEMAPVYFTADFEDIGTYTITRQLKVIINEADFMSQAADALEDLGLSEQGLIDQYLQNVDTVDCDFTCYDRAKTKAKLMYPGYNSTQIENVIPAIMDTMCVRLMNQAMGGGEAECESLLGAMITDVSPGGWMYTSDATSDFWTSIDVSSINTLLGTSFTLADLRDPTQWYSEISDELVKKHREYCHYLQCSTYAESKGYQNNMAMGANDWAEAKTQGFDDPFNEKGTSNVIDKDPISDVDLGQSFSLTANDGVSSSFSATDHHSDAIEFLMMHGYPGMSGKASFSLGLDQLQGTTVSGMVYPSDDQGKWSLFMSAYNAAWYQVYEAVKAASSCVYYHDGNQIFNEHPNLSDPSVQSGIYAGSANFWNSTSLECEDICAQNASAWLDQLNTETSGDLFAGLLTCDSAQVYTLLYNYCIGDCGTNNPFGMLRTGTTAYSNLVTSLSNCSLTLDSLTTVASYIDSCENEITTHYRVSDCMENIFKGLNSVLPIPTSNFVQAPPTSHAMWACINSYYQYKPSVRVQQTHNYEQFGLGDSTVSNCVLFSLWTDAGSNVDLNNVAQILSSKVNLTGSTSAPSSPGWTITYSGISVKVRYINNSIEEVFLYTGSEWAVCTSILAYESYEVPCQPYIDSAFAANLDTNRFNFQTAREDCIELIKARAEQNAKDAWQDLLQNAASQLLAEYNENCLQNSAESFIANYDLREYHYTLYYYDQAGNLVQTVPPEGVDILSSAAFPNGIYNQSSMPAHRLKTQYQYNSLNQLVWQSTPDGGETDFWYNNIGQLRFSQNAKQAPGNYFSYTKYDALGRIIEVGEHDKDLLNTLTFTVNAHTPDWPATKGWEVTQTHYDQVASAAVQAQFNQPQSHLRNRVATTEYIENTKDVLSQNNKITAATHYSYDVHGNVKELVQQQNYWVATPNRYKQMAYDYDLVSGNVKEVAYQKGHYDQFYHRYRYDADNRITRMLTSRDGERWETDARYEYYLHGPLARTVIGEDNVQGVDYAYTLQGWLKAVNGITVNASEDMGKDGNSTAHRWNAEDAFGFNLGYYQSNNQADYLAIGSTSDHIVAITAGNLTQSNGTKHRLYNGNIGFMATRLPMSYGTHVRMGMYQYDQLNRLKESKSDYVYDGFYLTTAGNHFKTLYDYDANGNIENLKRFDGGGSQSDDINYTYNKTSGELDNNKLASVSDSYNGPGDDIHGTHSYTYDNIGNLIADSGEDIGSIDWTVYGKIKSVNRNGGNLPNLAFGYGPDGNRMYKITKGNGTTPGNVHTWEGQWYVRDASGNVMAIYNEAFSNIGEDAYKSTLTLSELPLYGSSRVGLQEGQTTDTENAYFSGTSTATGFTPGTAYVLHDVFTTGDDYDVTNENGGDVTLGGGSDHTLTVGATYEKIYFTTSGEIEVPGDMFETDETGNYIPQGGEITITLYTGGEFELLDPIFFEIKKVFSGLTLLGKGVQVTRGVNEEEIFSERELLNKKYELSNHLGNVLTVVSDLKLGQDNNSDDIAEAYLADVLTYADYYPFGMTMPGRFANPGSYRYGGAGGQESDVEISGSFGNHYTAEYWELDARVGRRWNRDPVVKSWQSPYAVFDNNPIYYNDPSGAESTPCDDCAEHVLLDEVVVTGEASNKVGKVFKEIGSFFDKIGESLKEAGTQVAIFTAGVVNAWGTNQVMGVGRRNPQEFGPYSSTAQAGQTTGDVISIFTGAVEVFAGGGTEVVSLGTTSAVSIPLALHGVSVMGTATANMIKDGVERTHDNINGNPSSNGSSGGGSKKPTPDTNPSDFKKLPGNQGYVHKKTGEIYKKSHTSHGNKGNTGKQWKVWPKGTKDFGKNSKKSGKRTTVDGDGNIIGN